MLRRFALIAKIRLLECGQYSDFARSIRAVPLVLRGLLSFDPAERLCWLCRAYVTAQHSFLWEPIACAISLTCAGRDEKDLDWRRTADSTRYLQWEKIEPQIYRTTMPKAPGPDGEKGVLLSTFEYNWFLMIEEPETFRAICKDFNLVLSTSWSPTDYHLLALALAMVPDAVFWVQPCNLVERAKIKAFHPRLRALETMPCDWLNPEFFPQPRFEDRDIDLLVVSNWAPFKRHWALFNALRELPASLRVVCVGQPETGRTVEDIRRLQKLMGAPQEIEFLERLPINQVSALQCRAKVGLILSLWEGCCVAAAESLMAGAPLAMCKGAHVGPLAYISDSTGARLSRVPKASEIAQALVDAPRRQPRAFAEQRLSFLRSTGALNTVLKAHEEASGRPWTTDVVPMFWRPHPRLANESDRERLTPAYQRALSDRFPKRFRPSLLEESQQ